jgi:hypothetical protein
MWVIGPLSLVVLWLVITALVGYISGWTTLAKHYRLNSTFVGQRWRMQSAQMRWLANYNNCLTLGSNESGLYLSILPLFRFRHPPLLIPWEEISLSRKRLFFFEYMRLSLGRELGIPLLLRPRTADKLKWAAGDRWPMEADYSRL